MCHVPLFDNKRRYYRHFVSEGGSRQLVDWTGFTLFKFPISCLLKQALPQVDEHKYDEIGEELSQTLMEKSDP